MEIKKTKEFARQWIDENRPCAYRYGYAWKGASARNITKDKALELLPSFSFGMGFYELDFESLNGVQTLVFNEFSENDLY